jgi:CHAT domain-containing protein
VQEKVDEPVSGTVSFAEAFLAGGIANYVGTYWPVGDAPAKTFAENFYSGLLSGNHIGDALLHARRAVSKLANGAADWSDYVFYGDPTFILKPGMSEARSAGSSGSLLQL